MKKTFEMEDLDCANCAMKLEESFKKIEGVKDANVSYVMQKLSIEADDEFFDKVMKEVVKVCKKIEPDCTIVL